MSLLKQEGDHPVTLIKAEIVMGRWNNRPEDMDVKLTGEAEDGSTAAWYGELSNHYIQNGKLAGQTSYAVTMQTLQSLGFQGEDLSQIGNLAGTKTSFSVVRKDNGYLNIYINVSPEKVISPADAAAKLRLMFPQQGQQAPQQQQQQYQAPQGQQPQQQYAQPQQQYAQPQRQGPNPFASQPQQQQGQSGTNPF